MKGGPVVVPARRRDNRLRKGRGWGEDRNSWRHTWEQPSPSSGPRDRGDESRRDRARRGAKTRTGSGTGGAIDSLDERKERTGVEGQGSDPGPTPRRNPTICSFFGSDPKVPGFGDLAERFRELFQDHKCTASPPPLSSFPPRHTF